MLSDKYSFNGVYKVIERAIWCFCVADLRLFAPENVHVVDVNRSYFGIEG
jgi:hypothetical protein